MEPARFLNVLRRGWWVIAISGIVAGLAAFAYASTQTPLYKAKTSMYFSVVGGDSVTQMLQGSTFAQNQVRSFALLAYMPTVLDPVIDSLNLNMSASQLASTVSTYTPADTVLLDIMVTNPSPDTAAATANAIADQLALTVASLSASAPAGGSKLAVEARTVAKAQPPKYPVSPNKRKLTAMGIIAGMALGFGAILLRELLNTKVRTEADLREVTDATLLGVIGYDSTASRKPLILATDRSPRAEEMRRLRSNLEYLNYEGRLRSIVVTSALPSEGKTLMSTNLAIAMAASAQVLLIDADLRSPSVGEILGLDESLGLSAVLSGQSSFDEVKYQWRAGNLTVLTAGAIPPNPSQLLSSSAMSELLESLVERYDLVILDSAPILPVSDSTVLSKMADGALVIVNARKTTRHQLREALRTFGRSGARTLGVILNQAVTDKATAGYGTYGRVPEPEAVVEGQLMGAPDRQRPGRAADAPTSDANDAPKA